MLDLVSHYLLFIICGWNFILTVTPALKSDGLFLIEVDRVLKPGGYFVLTLPTGGQQAGTTNPKKGRMSNPIQEFAQRICWNLLSQQEETFIWQKTTDAQCYTSG